MNKKTNNEQLKEVKSWKMVLLSVLIFLFVLSVLYLVYNILIGKTYEDRGTFGDMFGIANALFSGLAFAGIIVTIVLQMRELKYQREELRETKLELRRTAAAQEKSEEALSKQVDSMATSAKITLISAIFNSYQTMATMSTVVHQDRISFTHKAKAKVKELEDLLEKIDNPIEDES